MSIYVQIKRALAATWTSTNPTLLAGQMGYETDTGRAKVGDGTTAWNSLAYRFESGGGGVTDGDKGDVVVSGGGAAWALDYTAVNAVVAPTWTNVSGKPSTFTPTTHTHALADLTISGATTNQVPQWNGSAWVPATVSGGGGVTDGDKGDIVVSGTGTVWAIDYTAVNPVIAPTWGNVSGKPAAVTSLSGTNTGDQTTIAGITGTKAQFNTAATDGDFLFVGDVTTNATHTGDATGATALTLATVNSNVGSFGSATQAGTFTVNGKGLVTAASNTTISVPATAISDSTTAGRAMVTAATAAAQTQLLDTVTSGAKGLAPASGGGTTNFLRADLTWAAPAGGGTPPNIQEFSAAGSSTWTKPAGAVSVHVILIGGGAGGASGRLRADSSTAAAGGGGGGGGGRVEFWIPASALSATESVTVGAAGTGGASRTTTAQDGAAGGVGGDTIFGAYRARGAQGAAVATAASGNAGLPGGAIVESATSTSNTYSASGGNGALGAQGLPGNRGGLRPGGGGGGGGYAAAETTGRAGGAGGLGGALLVTTDTNTTAGGGANGSSAGGSNGTAGANAANNFIGGSGGGAGGNGAAGSNGGTGGAGGYPGGGGAGGGAATLPQSSGAGGNGAVGFIRVTTFF